MKYVVVEINENKVLGTARLFFDEESAIEHFKIVVAEYGVEPCEEMINERIFESDDEYTIQILEGE